MARPLAIFSAVLLLALVALAREPGATAPPKLEIVTRLGALETVKVYNREVVLFFAREAGGDGSLLRGVKFVLYDEGGAPDRKEFVRAETVDEPRWGRPPSTFALPLTDRPLPIGRYRLRAAKRGCVAGEIKVHYARFNYFDLVVEHDEVRYAAKFHLRLEDLSEARAVVPVEVQVETTDGLLVDAQSVSLRRVAGREVVLETVEPIRISSRVSAYRTRTEERRPVVLRVVPRASLVLVLDGIRFAYPVPLPPEAIKSADGAVEDPSDPNRSLPRGR